MGIMENLRSDMMLLHLFLLAGCILDVALCQQNTDEDASLMQLLSKETFDQPLSSLEGVNWKHIKQIESNINGGGFMGDDLPLQVDGEHTTQTSEAEYLDNSSANDAVNRPENVTYTDQSELRSTNSENTVDSSYEAKTKEVDNAQKREKERHEETIGNPNPRPEFFQQEINPEPNEHLTKTSEKMEMEKGDAGNSIEGNVRNINKTLGTLASAVNKTINDQPSLLNQDSNVNQETDILPNHNKVIKIIEQNETVQPADELEFYTSQEHSMPSFSSTEAVNLLEAHHSIEPNDAAALEEEDRLSKRLDFLKKRLQHRKLVKNIHTADNTPSAKIHANSPSVMLQVHPKYVMQRIDYLVNKNESSLKQRNEANHSNRIVNILPLFKKPKNILNFKNLTFVPSQSVAPLKEMHTSPFIFSYDRNSIYGPGHWQKLNPGWTCNGRKQSPINIDNKYIMEDQIVKNIILKVEPPESPLTGVLKNNGHAPTLLLSDDVTVRMFGGILPNDYYLKQMHFHFGCDNTMGSEHQIDGVVFPLEVHLVFWDKSTFASFPDAAKADRGIAVLSVMYELSRNSKSLEKFVQALHRIEWKGDEVILHEDFNLRLEQLIPNVMNREYADRFYAYEGSLTTPGCYESVLWIVFASHPPVTQEQLDIFTKLHATREDDNAKKPMCNNFRTIQKKNGRRIYSNII